MQLKNGPKSLLISIILGSNFLGLPLAFAEDARPVEADAKLPAADSDIILSPSGEHNPVKAQNSLYELRLASLSGMENYSLTGSGFSADVNSSQGKGHRLQFRWSQAQATYSFNYLNLSQKFSSPAVLSPSEVQGNLERINLSREVALQSSLLESPTLLLGFENRKRSANQTAPNVLLPTQTTMGALAALGYSKAYNSFWSYHLQAGIYVPLLLNESSDPTGFYRYSFNPEASFEAIYKVNELIDFSIGLQAMMERIAYGGTGPRGSTDADETFLNFILPVELRFSF